jgi:hypothetical protein
MKRIISLVLALVLVFGMVPVALAASGPATSSNLDGHWYVNAQRWATPIYSNLSYENGEYVRAECIGEELVVEYYDKNFQFRTGKTIELELPLYGGVYMSSDYNFLVVGQTNFEEDNNKEVFRIIRYTKDWKKVDHASIRGANTTVPFDAGSCRFDRSGNVLYIRTAHEMYTSEDGLNHQSNVMIALRISDMTVTDQLTKVWNSGYGYVSHSFNQFVRVDGDALLAVDHGDFYPRSVALFKYGKKAGSEKFTAQASKKLSRITLSDDGEYVTVAGSSSEATVLLLHGNANPTGQYAVLKYRIPEGNPNTLGYWNFFTSTVNSDPSAPDSFAGEGVQIIADGKWHVVIFDIAAREKDTFAPAEDGSYTAKYFRFDVFNGAVSDGTSYDIAYIGLCDSLDDALAYNTDMNEVTLSLNTTVQQIIDPATGEEITAE